MKAKEYIQTLEALSVLLCATHRAVIDKDDKNAIKLISTMHECFIKKHIPKINNDKKFIQWATKVQDFINETIGLQGKK